MKLTLIRTDRETGKESFSILEAETLIEKIKKENKAAHVSALRHLIPILQGTDNHYLNIDKLPRIYPAVEYARTKDGEHRVKIYNGLVQIEVNHLANAVEVEQVKRQAALLPQTFAAFCGTEQCIDCANGTDAIELVLRAMGIRNGNHVATVANTAVATVAGIERSGAEAVFADICR